MSRDFDDIYKKIDQSHKELYKQDNEISRDIDNMGKNQEKILKEISDIKKEVKNIGSKVETVLEILNNFTIMLAEDDDIDEPEENYDFNSDESWVPDEESWRDDMEDDE